MNLPPQPARDEPTGAQPLADRGPAPAAAARLPLAAVLLGLSGVAALLSALLGWTLVEGFALAAGLAAPLAALAGLVVVLLPLGLILRRLTPPAPALPEVPPAVDPGTGAASHAALLAMAGREWSRARRYGTGAAVLLVDVDRFARLCEARGPDAGEAVLRELARQVAPTLRGADVLARSGGAQLAVFLVQADAMGALDVAERIRERAEQLDVPWHPQRLRFTVSVGVAHLRPAHDSVQALFDDAGDAVQAARDAGGNCVRAAPVERRDSAGSPRANDQRTRP